MKGWCVCIALFVSSFCRKRFAQFFIVWYNQNIEVKHHVISKIWMRFI